LAYAIVPGWHHRRHIASSFLNNGLRLSVIWLGAQLLLAPDDYVVVFNRQFGTASSISPTTLRD
jgi:hypothetical protein